MKKPLRLGLRPGPGCGAHDAPPEPLAPPQSPPPRRPWRLDIGVSFQLTPPKKFSAYPVRCTFHPKPSNDNALQIVYVSVGGAIKTANSCFLASLRKTDSRSKKNDKYYGEQAETFTTRVQTAIQVSDPIYYRPRPKRY